MKGLTFLRYGVSACAAAAILYGCSGSQPLAGPGTMPAQPQAGHVRSACPNVVGKPTCFALFANKGIGPACSGATCGLAPIDLQTRYKLPITKGKGQVVALIDAGDNPTAASDLATYRSQFGLGTGTFEKYNQNGQQSNYPTYTAWSVEEDLDIEMVAATCPNCTIDLVEANSSDSADLQAAEAEAVTLGAKILSNSWGCYNSNACVDQSYFDTPGIAYLAATGDAGLNETGAPAAFTSVGAIGGTQLEKSGSTYSETVWEGAGGGCDSGISKPKWQHDKVCATRALADGAAEAGCSPGVAEYDSFDGGWFGVCGTSAASPIVAGSMALAGNAAHQKGGRTFWKSKHRKDLWNVCGSQCLFGQYSYGGGWGSPNGIGAL
jgi:subtilase family serine protease